MFEDQKMKKSVVITLALLSVFLAAKVIGEMQSWRFIGSYPSSPSNISVSGKGEVVGIPDLATFSFGVTEESLVVRRAQDEAAKAINAMLEYLKKNGVAEKDIQTSGYTIYPRYEYSKGIATSQNHYADLIPGTQTLAAYVVSQTVTVKVRKLEDAGKLLAGIGELGADNVSGLTFDFDKRDELVKEARDKAIKEAREEAAKLAKALGVRLVRIVNYNDNNFFPVFMKAAVMEGRGGDMGGPVAPQIPVGEDKIVSHVTIVYEVK